MKWDEINDNNTEEPVHVREFGLYLNHSSIEYNSTDIFFPLNEGVSTNTT